MSFLACRVFKDPEIHHELVEMETQQLSEGDTLIQVDYSSINYKDALAASGRGAILKSFPLNAGIDLAGKVVETTGPGLKEGDDVIVNGCGLGESFDGGLAQFARVDSQYVMKQPKQYSGRDAMIIGTAGFTAALAIYRMEVNGQTPDKGPIVVTGASGGVGSFAVNLLSKKGYETIAVTSQSSMHDYLKDLGATEIKNLSDFELSDKPLSKGVYGGLIDNIGGETLSKLMANIDLWGNIACIGLAQSPKLEATVLPLILRGVSLLGVSSTNCPMPLREQLWHQFGADNPLPDFGKILSKEISLKDVSPYFEELIDNKHHGRLIVNCQ
ncbi:YhdH/YhfP family quinone oxidoreductase [Kangiella sediminilitoris]|uniref:Quinone oxidoreductase, YhdH/YhfP family n=1 Tax=Kangiella sediminilitoris TaxID=1144748 RepID=A0A1B3BC76_9GAMM|nr:YhdH/YhfP family quinone oxidoreductase [Kangiella sediminilitoris]AOE50421.1 Quinone oxidoreductase, YhdH/YhfP family [Kangiella sediminilitoris]